MEVTPLISTLPPELKSQDFQFLRSEGLSVIQRLAEKSWTDHNLHDPGITMLEAMCYAMTEAGLRAGMDVKDLLTSGGVHRAAEFFTAAQVLPSAPVTVTDLRKMLIDHPMVRNAWFFPLKSMPLGRYSALLEFEDDTLNSNTFAVTTPGGYTVDIAFPHWDDEDIFPFRENVTLLSIAFEDAPNEWNEIEGNTTFFSRAIVQYQPPVGAAAEVRLWVVAQITSEMDDPLTEAPPVLAQLSTMIANTGNGQPMKQLNERVMAAHDAMRIIRRYTLTYRNLCENVAEFNAVRQQEIGLTATIEVGADVNIEALLAEIFYRLSNHIAPSLQFTGLDEQLERHGGADEVFDGPLTDGGFLDGAVLGAQQIMSILYTSDILRLIYQLRNADNDDVDQREDVNARKIIAVRGLSLANYLDNRPISTKARDCLQLVKSQRHIPRLSVTKSRIIVFRNGVEIGYDANHVLELYNEKKAADIQGDASTVKDIAVPVGETYPVGEYYPIQNDLPVTYGVGAAGLPEHATITRRAQAKQLKGYLFLFEQMVAGFQAQLSQFNTFFSADPAIGRTLFQQPLYHLPEVAPLIKSYNGNTPLQWQEFQADASNGYAQLLQNAVESRAQFLERRNAVLDHLLAVQGEDMQERAAMQLRMAAQVPGSESMMLPQLLAAQQEQRLNALEDLLYDKSAYYYASPSLNRDKAQAFGHPAWRLGSFITVTRQNGGFAWLINDPAGNAIFQQFELADSASAAQRAAEQAMKLSTSEVNYTSRAEGADVRLEVRTSPDTDPVAETVTLVPAADGPSAIVNTASQMQDIWAQYALIPLEARLYHMLGIDLERRRPLVHNISDYIDIYDDPVPNPDFRKLFRVRAVALLPGNILLESTESYPGADNAAAIVAAQAVVDQFIDQGAVRRNYSILEPAPGTYRIAFSIGNVTLALSPGTFPDMDAAEAGIQRIMDLVMSTFSAQGCFLVEHHLLYPPTDMDIPLTVPGQDDPYSFQLTVIFPSGYQRDFTVPNSLPQPARPALYRSAEFRKYAEQQVRKHCPANVLPRILWVDRASAGDGTAPSLDAFELLYFSWLGVYMSDEPDAATLDASRNALTSKMNALYQEYYTV